MSYSLSNRAAPLKVLLIEDDQRLAALTARYLESHGLQVTIIYDGTEGLKEARKRQFDVVLLDIQLPGTNGMTLCRELRNHSSVPIIMISARGEETDRVLGLEAGADDYLCKPFSSRELRSRIHASVRRARGLVGPSRNLVNVGRLRLDPVQMEARLGSDLIPLTTQEFSLLFVLAQQAGVALSREQLLDIAGAGADEAFDRSIDVHISRLRQKLGDNAKRPQLLKTVRGVGYMLVPNKS